MSNIFNLQRFLWLFNKHTKEHFKTYLISVAVMIGILIIALIVLIINGAQNGNDLVVVMAYVYLEPILGVIFTSFIFSNLGDKRKAMQVLMLPVSNLERFLVAWIYSFVIFQLIFIICFCPIVIVYLKMGIVHLANNRSFSYAELLPYAVLHSIAFLGSIFFKKTHFIKTASIFFVGMSLLFLINKSMINSLIKQNVTVYMPFSAVIIEEKGGNVFFLEPNSGNTILGVFAFITTACLWTATYFKLKEKQV